MASVAVAGKNRGARTSQKESPSRAADSNTYQTLLQSRIDGRKRTIKSK